MPSTEQCWPSSGHGYTVPDRLDPRLQQNQSKDKDAYGHNPGWKPGIRTGSAKTGVVTAFIPDLTLGTAVTRAPEGVATDAEGNVYGAEVGPKDVKKYVKI